MAYYAWASIRHGVERDKADNTVITAVKEVKPGDTVTAAQLGISNDEFQYLIDSGAVREQKYPEDLRLGETPRLRAIRIAKELMDDAVEGALAKTGTVVTSTPATEIER